jgi:hypothetical protein
MDLSMAQLEAWASRYFHAWQTNERALVEALFSPAAVYHYGPFREPARGREEIVERWVNGESGLTRAEFRAVAVEGADGVVQWRVTTGGPDGVEMDGVLIVRFDDDGLCAEHREWYAVRPAERS